MLIDNIHIQTTLMFQLAMVTIAVFSPLIIFRFVNYTVCIQLVRHSRVAKLIFHIFAFPGVVFHELSHLVMVKILGCRVDTLCLYNFDVGNGSRSLGYVNYVYDDKFGVSFKHFLIGLAPLYFALLLLVFFYAKSTVHNLFELFEGEWTFIGCLNVYLLSSIVAFCTPSSTDVKNAKVWLCLLCLAYIGFALFAPKLLLSGLTVYLDWVLAFYGVCIQFTLAIAFISLLSLGFKKHFTK